MLTKGITVRCRLTQSRWFRCPLLLVCSTAVLGGCTGWSPVIAGDNYFGLGWFQDLHQPDPSLPAHIDARGVGVLMVPGRVTLGYTHVNMVFADQDKRDISIRLSRGELHSGEYAVALAEQLADSKLHVDTEIQK